MEITALNDAPYPAVSELERPRPAPIGVGNLDWPAAVERAEEMRLIERFRVGRASAALCSRSKRKMTSAASIRAVSMTRDRLRRKSTPNPAAASIASSGDGRPASGRKPADAH